MHFGRYASRKSEAKYTSLWDGLVGAWCPSVQNPSGNTLYDLSGRNNHGTLTNMDPATDWVRDGGRGALDFDINDDAISIPFRTPAMNAISISFWANIRTGGAGGFGRFLTRSDSSIFSAAGSTAQIEFAINSNKLTGNIAMPLNQWVHYSFVFLSGSQRTIYRNSVIIAQDVLSSTIAASTVPLFIANRSDFTRGRDGRMDDILIHDRAISHAEIRILASQRGIAFTPKRRSIFRQLTNRLRSSRFAAFPA